MNHLVKFVTTLQSFEKTFDTSSKVIPDIERPVLLPRYLLYTKLLLEYRGLREDSTPYPRR